MRNGLLLRHHNKNLSAVRDWLQILHRRSGKQLLAANGGLLADYCS
jgi:hypothetical protein